MKKIGFLSDLWGRIPLLAGLIIGIAFALYGCGGGGGGSLDTNPSDQVSYARAMVPQSEQSVSPDGTTKVPITLYVYNRDGHILTGGSISVSVSPSIGQMSSYGTENKGVNTFYYTVPNYTTIQKAKADHVTITFTITTHTSKLNNDNTTKASTSVDIYFNEVPSSISAVIPDNSTITQADGKTVIPITIYAYGGGRSVRSVFLPNINIYTKAIPNVGSFDSTVKTTDNNGVATFNYTVPSKDDLVKAGARKVTLMFTDSTGAIKDNITLTFANVGIGDGIPSAVILNEMPDTIMTNNVSGSTYESMITAYIVDSAGFPINSSDYTVKFSLLNAPVGTKLSVDNSSITNGYAYTSIVSGSTAGTAILVANVCKKGSTCSGSDILATASTPIRINGGQSNSINLVYGNSVTANDSDGTRSIKVYAYMENSQGLPVADGTKVNFSVSDDCGGWITGTAQTVNGVATATLTYPSQCIWKTFSLTANAGTLSTSQTGHYPAKDPVDLSLTSPSTVPSGGGDVTINISLKDENGNGLPLSDNNVMFYSNADNVTISPSSVQLDNYGTGTVTVSIPKYTCDNTTSSSSGSSTQTRNIVVTGQTGTAIKSVTIEQDCE